MKQHNRSYAIGKRAIAALLSTTLLTTGAVVATPQVAGAEETATSQAGLPTTSVTGATPRGEGKFRGGTLSHDQKVTPGGLLTIKGSGFEKRANDELITFKLNDGSLEFPETQDGTVRYSQNGWVELQPADLPDDQGNFTATVRVPENLELGHYWVRALGAEPGVSTYGWFEVVEKLPEEGEETPTSKAAATAENGYTSSLSGSAGIPVSVAGFPAGAELSVQVDDKPAEWVKGRRDTASTITTDGEGAAAGTVHLKAGEFTAGVPVKITVRANDDAATTAVSNEIIIDPAVTLLSSTNDQLGDSSLNATVIAKVSGLPAGATVTFVGTGDTNFLTTDQKGVSDDASVAEIKDVKIPGDDSLIGKAVTIKYTVDGTDRTLVTDTVITPSNTLFGTEKYTLDKVEYEPGLYQVRFNSKNGKLYIARTDRRINRGDTSLMIVNPDTLEIEKNIVPAGTAENNAQVFGVGLDEKRGHVWTTNSTADAVAVYSADDLSLIHQFPAGTVSHGRDVVIDEETGNAYVSSPRSSAESLTVFNAETKKVDTLATPGFAGAISLELNQQTGDLYSVSMTSPKALKINVRTGESELFELPADKVDRASGLAIDPATGHLYIANQGTNNVVVFDPATKQLIADIPTGEQALGVVYNPVTKMVYAVNRSAGTLTVIDPKTNKKVANLDAGIFANDATVDDKGRIFVTNKVSRTGVTKDGFYRYTPIEEVKGPGSSIPGSSNPDLPSSSSMPKLLTGFLVSFGIAGGLAALFGFLAKSGIIPVHLLPVELRNLLHL